MDIKETNNFIIFENVEFGELELFHDLPYKLWFLKGSVREGLFVATFHATTLDIKTDDLKDELESENPYKLETDFTLYFLKNQNAVIENLMNILDDFMDITDELQQQCDDTSLKGRAQDMLKMMNR